MFSQSNLALSRFRSQHTLLSFISFAQTFVQLTKRLVFGRPSRSLSLLQHFENNYYSLQQLFNLLRELTVQVSSRAEDPPKVYDELRGSIKQVHLGQTSVFELIATAAQAEERIITCALASVITDEGFLDHLVLYLSHVPLMTTDLYEPTLLLACRLLFYICTCRGGIPLLMTTKSFMESLTDLLNLIYRSPAGFADRVPESSFNQIINKDVSAHSRFNFAGAPSRDWLAGTRLTPQLRLASIAGQYGYLFQNINSAVSVMNEVFQKLLDWDNHHLLLMHLTQIDKLFNRSLLSRQAMLLTLREPTFFDLLLIPLDIEDHKTFGRQRFEVHLVCKMLFELLRESRLPLIINSMGSLRRVLTKIGDVFQSYMQEACVLDTELQNAELSLYLRNLSSVITPFERLKEDFLGFLSGFQSSSRYTHTNINTLLANKQHYSTVEREFPKLDPKRYYARLADYISFFQTTADPDNKLCLALSYLKAINYALKVNMTLFQDFVKENVFDMVNFLALVGANVVTAFMGGSQLSREIQRAYSASKNRLMDGYLDLTRLALKVLIRKTAFKERQEVEGKEYENTDLFIAIMDLLAGIKNCNPAYFHELCATRVLEMKGVNQELTGPNKVPLSHFKLANKVGSLSWTTEAPDLPVYLAPAAKHKAIRLMPKLFRFVALFSRFPGSYDTLLCELIFMVFQRPICVEVYLSAIAVFVSEPRRGKDRDKFKRMIQTIIFEKVRTAKRSSVVLTQKHGCMRADSVFDLYVSDSGKQRTIEYLMHNFLTASEPRVFSSFSLLLIALMEWKDPQFCTEICFTYRSVLRNHVALLKDTLGFSVDQIEKRRELMDEVRMWVRDNRRETGPVEDDKVLFLVKTIGRVIQMANLTCLSGLLKLLLIEDDILTDLLTVLDLGCVYAVFEHPDIEPAFLNLKCEILKLLNVFMNADVGFSLRPGEGLSDDKTQTDIPGDYLCFAVIEMVNRELEVDMGLREALSSDRTDEDWTSIERLKMEALMRALELLRTSLGNQKVRLICCYGPEDDRPVRDRHPALDVRSLSSFMLRYGEDSSHVQPRDRDADRDRDNGRSRRDDRDKARGRPQDRDLDEPVTPPVMPPSDAGPRLNPQTATRLIRVLDVYLQCVLKLIPRTSDNSFIYTEFGIKSLMSILFRRTGFRVHIDKLNRLHTRLASYSSKPDVSVRIRVMLGALDSYASHFDRERKRTDRHDTPVAILETRKRLADYNRHMVRFDDTLIELSNRRFFLNNFFPQVCQVLDRRFKKSTTPKNITKETLATNPRLFLDIECELSREARLRRVDRPHRHHADLGRRQGTHQGVPQELRDCAGRTALQAPKLTH